MSKKDKEGERYINRYMGRATLSVQRERTHENVKKTKLGTIWFARFFLVFGIVIVYEEIGIKNFICTLDVFLKLNSVKLVAKQTNHSINLRNILLTSKRYLAIR